ncbi:t-SNARE domain-containing protein 1 [Folsomia candida]|uniref:Regulatory protein zeste n=1 Tax=Folsomia candida TaxID=158441 RepID=A0A226E9R3_FOLCA|nr:t-SNARE domain-containing protein 1 [Folsomia candida]
MSGRPNFSSNECEALVDTVGLHFDALFGKFSLALTNDRKNELWNDVTQKVNAVSTANPPRTVAEIKKKYQVLKTNVKQVETANSNEMKKTGGGTATLQPQSSIGEKLLALIPRVEIVGIEGGLDISKLSTIDPAPLNLISIIEPTANNGETRKSITDATTDDFDEDVAQIPKPKKQVKRSAETTLFALQAKQVKLLEVQTEQLARIGDLLAQRNSIEQAKLELMKN